MKLLKKLYGNYQTTCVNCIFFLFPLQALLLEHSMRSFISLIIWEISMLFASLIGDINANKAETENVRIKRQQTNSIIIALIWFIALGIIEW